MQKNIIYQGKLSEYQTTPKVRQEQIIFEGLNSNQTELYRRAMYGLKIYPQETVRAMTNLQRRKITKKCKRAQSVLNIWKQEICNSMANKLIAKHFKMTPVVETFIGLHADYVDVEYVNNLSFKDLGIKRVDIIRKFIREGILPNNFYDIKDEVSGTDKRGDTVYISQTGKVY
jgi:hypothetical protein